MKKTKFLALTLVTCLLFTFVGCGSSNVSAIKETAETFLKAATDADIDTVSANCTEDVLSDLGLVTLDPAYNEDDFYTGLGVDKSVLSEDAQAAVSSFCEYFSENLIQGYSITDVTEEDGVGTVKATVTTYSTEALDSLSGADFQADLTTLMTTYQEEHLEELQNTYINEGEDAMMIELFNGLIPEIMNVMKTNFDAFSPEEVELVLEIENVDDKWIVTDGYMLE